MIGVVVVTYNSAEVVGACLDSCRSYETVVVDNASADSTLQEIGKRPWVRVISNRENLGFAAAVNQGVECLETEFILLLNPDVQLLDGLEPLVEACSLPGTAAASGLLVDENGQAQYGFSIRRFPTATTLIYELLGLNRIFPQNPINRRYRCLDLDFSRAQIVEQPAGAFLLFRRNVWEGLGELDPQFFPLWFEDVDFCHRIVDSGQSIRFVPEVRARHRGAHSIVQLSWSCRELYWYGSLLKYAAKYFKAGAYRGVCLAVGVGSFLRTTIAVVRERTFKPLLAYQRVIHLAFSSAVKGITGESNYTRNAAESSKLRKIVDVQSRR